jgi:hypothetical protein
MTCCAANLWAPFVALFLVGCSSSERGVLPGTASESPQGTSRTPSERVASNPQAASFAHARRHVRESPRCQNVLKEYPAILDNAQELPSQAPVTAVAFDHDEVIADSSAAGRTRLNVRILVTFEGGALKSIEVKETNY